MAGEQLNMQAVITRVLVVDDEPETCAAVADVLYEAGRRQCTMCATAAEACAALDRDRYDVVVTDVILPGMSGLALLDRVVRLPSAPRVIVVSGAATPEWDRRAMEQGAFRCIAKPFDPQDLRRGVDEAAGALVPYRGGAAMRDSWDGSDASVLSPQARPEIEFVRALAAALECKDPFSERHSLAVSAYCEVLALRIDLPAEAIRSLKTAAILHDVGKIGVPDFILQKPGPLTPAEFRSVERHPEVAVRILGHVQSLREHLPIIRHHHERFDGGGYPTGLAGEAIPLGARILSVADAMETMLTGRPYQKRLESQAVRAELLACAGTQFDDRIASQAVGWLEHTEEELCGPAGLHLSVGCAGFDRPAVREPAA